MTFRYPIEARASLEPLRSCLTDEQWERLAMLASTRDRSLEDWLSRPQTRLFSLPGSVAVVADCGRWYPDRPITIVDVLGTLGTSGSSTTTFRVLKNGSSIKSMSLSSGENVEYDDVTPRVRLNGKPDGTGDYLDVDTTAAGTSAKDLLIAVRYVERLPL